jgi:sporulation delaying protein A
MRNTISPRPRMDVGGLGRRSIAIVIAWILIVGCVVDSQVLGNAVGLPFGRPLARAVRIITPQGWAFFTFPVHKPRLQAWKPRDDPAGRWISAQLGPNAQPRHLGGLDRSSRTQLLEMAVLSDTTPAARWITCPDGTTSRCFNHADPVRVVNVSRSPTLCGRVGLSQTPPVPWEWRARRDTLTMPSRVIVLDVAC